jgi:glycosyltransferase involved in cell wall biosynthesis
MPGKIIIDCERMKYPNTGLYHFCRELSNALIRQQNKKNNSLAFYVPPAMEGFLKDHSMYEIQQWWHKIYIPFKEKYNLWHGTYQSTNYYPQQGKIKKMLTIHDLNFLYDDRKSEQKQKKYLRHIQEKINRSDQLTVISKFTLKCVQDNLKLNNTPVEVIYNGCNLPEQNKVFEQPSFIKKNIPYLLSIGTVAVKKNFHTLPCLLKGNDYHLVIAGVTQDEDYLEKIITEAKKHGVEERLILPGAVTDSEKWWLMKNMLALVFPSLAEGFGLPVIEAMNFGKPVILSTHTSLPEIGSTAAYYFDSFDSEDMQKTLEGSLQHFNAHPGLPDIIKKHASIFNWEEAAKQYLRLYDKLLPTA